MRLMLVRHGETAWNAVRRYQGHHPVALNERGRWQAQQAGRRLARCGAAALYASDIARAWETAELIGVATGLVPHAWPAFREINDGDWVGLTPEELEQRYPEHMAAMRASPAQTMRLNGESYAQLQQRMIVGFEQLAARHPHDTLIAVSHGGAIRALVCFLLDAPLENFGRLWIDNGGFAEIVSMPTGGWRVLRVNDVAHLLDSDVATGE